MFGNDPQCRAPNSGRRKTWSSEAAVANNLKLHVDKMMERQLEQALETIVEDPNKTTIIDTNGNNHDNIKIELIENENNE